MHPHSPALITTLNFPQAPTKPAHDTAESIECIMNGNQDQMEDIEYQFARKTGLTDNYCQELTDSKRLLHCVKSEEFCFSNDFGESFDVQPIGLKSLFSSRSSSPKIISVKNEPLEERCFLMP